MWFRLPPSPSSLLICWCFLYWWVSSSRRNPGVPTFYPLFFYGRPSPGYGCACRAFLDLHSLWCVWSQFPQRWGTDTPRSLAHSRSLGTLPWVVLVVSAPSKMRCRHSQVAGHTLVAGHPAPGGACSLSCLSDELQALPSGWAHSPVVGHTPGHWAPFPVWCLQSKLPPRWGAGIPRLLGTLLNKIF